MAEAGYFWADGAWHKDRPPSEENITFVVRELTNAGLQPPKPPPPPPRRPVPKRFKSTARTRLRESALSLAVSAAHLIYRGVVTSADLIRDAEEIERWIADTPREKP